MLKTEFPLNLPHFAYPSYLSAIHYLSYLLTIHHFYLSPTHGPSPIADPSNVIQLLHVATLFPAFPLLPEKLGAVALCLRVGLAIRNPPNNPKNLPVNGSVMHVVVMRTENILIQIVIAEQFLDPGLFVGKQG